MPLVGSNEESSLIDSSEDRKDLKEEQDEAYLVSLLMDQKKQADLERKNELWVYSQEDLQPTH